MEIKDIETVLAEALVKQDDTDIRNKYVDSITEYLKDHKSSDELVTIVVKGMNIDRAANYYDYLENIPKNDIPSVWKQVRENKEILLNKDNNGLKFVSGLLALSFMKAGNVESQSGNFISKLISMVSDEKNPISNKTYGPVILDFFVDEIASVQNYPKWESFNNPGKINKNFAEMIMEITGGEHEGKYKNIRQWASNGIKIAEEQIERERIEAKIPKSMVSDLQAIVDHYKSVEKQVRDEVYDMARMEKEIERLRNDISKLNSDKQDLESKITSLNNDVDTHKKEIIERDKEIEERKKINDAADALKKNDEEGMLRDIANELKAEYRDFVDSENDEMDIQLGEIYKEKLRNIFKILEKKGIKME